MRPAGLRAGSRRQLLCDDFLEQRGVDFTEGERAYCERRRDPTERYAARFAAKEAVMKALGAGIGDFEFRDVEVVRAESGEPALALRGKAASWAEQRGVVGWHVSLSHTHTTAVAVVIAVGA